MKEGDLRAGARRWATFAACTLIATAPGAAAQLKTAVGVDDFYAIVRTILVSKLPDPTKGTPPHPLTYFLEIDDRDAASVIAELGRRDPAWAVAQERIGTRLKPHAEMTADATGCAVDRALGRPAMGIGIGKLARLASGRIRTDVGYFMCPHMSGEDTVELARKGSTWRIVATRPKWRT